jgi:membrane dipeptidase
MPLLGSPLSPGPPSRASLVRMKRLLLLLLLVLVAFPLAAQAPDEADVRRARAILETVPLIDGHNDLPWALRMRVQNRLAHLDISKPTSGLDRPLHTDIPRLRAGGVSAQFWSVWIPPRLAPHEAVQTVLEQIDVVHRLALLYPETFVMATTADQIVAAHEAKKIASLIGLEGGHSINDSLAVLRQLHALGARYMTLTHSDNTRWADAATDDPQHDGLSRFGREVVAEMNRLGMMVDLSHVSPATMSDAIEVSVAPVIFSHSSARALTDHPRNVPDPILRRVKETGGIVMVTFVPAFVSEEVRLYYERREAEETKLRASFASEPDTLRSEIERWRGENPPPRATVAQVADHVDHLRKVAGIDHVGIGGDFDGIFSTPEGLESVADYPNLFAELLRRGYSDEELRKIAGLNMLRVMRAVEAAAARLASRAPSDLLIGETDAPAPREQKP